MHFVVTARITPFNPGASPPPVSIPTLRTSAISLSFVQRVERISLAALLPAFIRELIPGWQYLRIVSMVSTLFICTGNICRSPMAQGVFENVARREGLAGEIAVDSAVPTASTTPGSHQTRGPRKARSHVG